MRRGGCARGFVEEDLGDVVGPRVDDGPLAVVAEASAEGVVEEPRGEWPLVLLDHAAEDAVVAWAEPRSDGCDVAGFFAHDRAEERGGVAE